MPSFEKRLSAVVSGLESASSADVEVNFLSFDPKELKFGIKFKVLVFPCPSESTFEDDFSASSCLGELIATSSIERSPNTDEFLTSVTKDSTASPSIIHKKSFRPTSGECYSEGIFSASTLQIENRSLWLYPSESFKSSFF